MQPEVNLNLHDKQCVALDTEATEVLYGGAAGGGKSHLMRAAAIIWCSMIPGLQVYVFRRIEEDLVKNHVEGPKGFRALLAEWVNHKFVEMIEGEIRFWNGSKIYLCHCKDEKHRFKYLGAEMHVLMIDELTTFTDTIYRFLRNRVRMVGMTLPKEYDGMFPRVLCSSNPGNIGHLFVKRAFIDGAKPYEIRQMPGSEGGMRRQFIPARMDDNPSLMEDDPEYIHKLEGLGSEALVRAMRDGDWDVVEGAYFDCWDSAKHVIRPVTLPEHWLAFTSFDWGSARPFSHGWWRVATEHWIHPDGFLIPKGALIRYREWYGAKEPNVGLKMTVEDVARGIVERESESIAYRVADPSIFAEDGGPSFAERMYKAAKLVQKPADNKRIPAHGHVGGWDQMRGRLIGEDFGKGNRPMIYCFDTCLDSIRTIPALQHDETKPEDVDTDGEDHAGDDWRYACMSRPYTRPKPPEDEPLKGMESLNIQRLWNEAAKRTEHRI